MFNIGGNIRRQFRNGVANIPRYGDYYQHWLPPLIFLQHWEILNNYYNWKAIYAYGKLKRMFKITPFIDRQPKDLIWWPLSCENLIWKAIQIDYFSENLLILLLSIWGELFGTSTAAVLKLNDVPKQEQAKVWTGYTSYILYAIFKLYRSSSVCFNVQSVG